MRKPTFWFPTCSGTNHAVQVQKMARGLKVRIRKVEGLFYLCSEIKGADQLRVFVFAFAYAKCWFSHDAVHIWDRGFYRFLGRVFTSKVYLPNICTPLYQIFKINVIYNVLTVYRY